MSDANLWWLAAGVAVAAELLTGSFYLLMLALGLGAAGLAAYVGATGVAQTLVAALFGGGAVALWHFWRVRNAPPRNPQANPDVNLDVGSTVRVEHWNEDGSAQVQYRGAPWAARWAGPGSPQPGLHVIRAVEGSRLVLDTASHTP